MFFEDWEIIVRYRDYDEILEIVPIKKNLDGSRVIAYPENGSWSCTETPHGQRFPDDIRDKLLSMPSALAEKLFITLGKRFIPKGPTATEKELEATKFHLKDMREIVRVQLSLRKWS